MYHTSLLLLPLLFITQCLSSYLGLSMYNTPVLEMNLCNKSESFLLAYVMDENAGCVYRDLYTQISNEVITLNGTGDLEISVWNRCDQIMVNKTIMTTEERTSGVCAKVGVNRFVFLYYGDTIEETLSYMDLPLEPQYTVNVNRLGTNCTDYSLPVGMLYFPGLENRTRSESCVPASQNEIVWYTDYGTWMGGLTVQNSSASMLMTVGALLCLLFIL